MSDFKAKLKCTKFDFRRPRLRCSAPKPTIAVFKGLLLRERGSEAKRDGKEYEENGLWAAVNCSFVLDYESRFSAVEIHARELKL